MDKNNNKAEVKVNIDKKEIMSRIVKIRRKLLIKAPFFGNLLLHLKISLANCETACTDMRRIIFDPAFVSRLSDDEVEFVLRHEVMHCVLHHCTRGKSLNYDLYNIAADIVVNSNIMHSMGVNTFNVDGLEAMHQTPDGDEGYKYSAEEVYNMLIAAGLSLPDCGEGISAPDGDEGNKGNNEGNNGADKSGKNKNDNGFDSHTIWDGIEDEDLLDDEWNKKVLEAVNGSGFGDVPPGARKLLEDLQYEAKVNWREVLNDFIQITNDNYDYTFAPVDKRYSDSEFILPAFNEIYGEELDKLWFVIDTSASMEDETIAHIFAEIKAAINQFEHLKGMISFFDTRVSEPIPFESVETLRSIEPVGGGGTNFFSIFKYMVEHMAEGNGGTGENSLPTAIIILTDGYAHFPKEEMALGVPVLWVIAETDVEPPWGTIVHI